MPKTKTPTTKKKTSEFKVPKEDELEFRRFKKMIDRTNAHRIDPETKFLKEFNMHEVRYASPQQSAIMDTFNFKNKDVAEHCVQMASKML